MATFNMTASSNLPPLPEYTTQPLPALVPGIPDKYLTLVLPIIAYWGLSMIFHYIDMKDWFPQYRLHTPVEVSNRNHVSRYEVVRDVVIQQVVQTIVGFIFTYFDPDQQTGMDDYNVAVWAQRLRIVEGYIPTIFGFIGLDSAGLAQDLASVNPSLAGALVGGQYPMLFTKTTSGTAPAFASWELQIASFIYSYAVPACQFAFAMFVVDTWQYFLHRAMHMNKWLYTTFHSRHHRLYVPYAYGALYNHPFEGFLLDTLGAMIAYLASGLTVRQTMWFFTLSTMKTVDDHCGYAFPWDPLQHLSSNNAGYHDVHHQSWGIKANFSQPFFTFWDRFLGTVWTGGDVSARYERSRLSAERKEAAKSITGSSPEDSKNAQSDAPYDASNAQSMKSAAILPQVPSGKAAAQAADSRKQTVYESGSAGGPSVLAEETAEEQREIEAKEANCLPGVMRPSNASARDGGMMKAVRERMHRRKGSLLGGSMQ